MRKSRLSSFGLKVSGYLFAVCGVAVVTGALVPFNDCLSSTTVALAAFLITALVAGELSARAKRRAEEAEAGRREIERLYNEYRAAAERARQAEVFEQSERLKSALLNESVAIS